MMQAKDVPDKPILEFLRSISPRWANWAEVGSGDWDVRSVRRAMPADLPPKLILAKMHALIRRGLIYGCDCGCRGDFVLTEKGQTYLEREA